MLFKQKVRLRLGIENKTGFYFTLHSAETNNSEVA